MTNLRMRGYESMSIPIPFGVDRVGFVVIPVDMKEEDWAQLERVLEAYDFRGADVSDAAGRCKEVTGR